MPSITETEARVKVRLVDLDRLRSYLAGVGRLARYAARQRDPREVLAAVNILILDMPQGLARASRDGAAS